MQGKFNVWMSAQIVLSKEFKVEADFRLEKGNAY